MIPHGLNPHGLEDKTLTFIVVENNNVVYQVQSKNRLYCWAVFPQAVKNYIQSNYNRTDFAFAIEYSESEDGWNGKPKYVSKNESGNWFMVQGNQTFYWQIWKQEDEIIAPAFATVYVLDTSGSMTTKDYTEVKKGIVSEIYDYNCFHTSPDTKMFVYSASFLKNMNTSDAVFGTVPVGGATLTSIWGAVSPFIDVVPRNKSSESMITNLYYSIANMIQRMFYGRGHTDPGKKCTMSACTFVLLTDESIFTNDTLQNVDYLYDASKPAGENKGVWYSNWFADCKTYNLFPLSYTTNDTGRAQFCQNITDALRYLSYYYGVNFTWGLYEGLDTYSNDIKAVKTQGTAPWLNKVKVLKVDEAHPDHPNEDITYVNGGLDAWLVPDTFHVDAPHNSMCRIALEVPTEFIDGDMAFKNDLIMQYSDQFQKINSNHPERSPLLAHFWRDGINAYNNDEYSAFRFLNPGSFIDYPVYLPQISSMNLKEINPNTGIAYQYKWQTYGQWSEIPAKTIACGGEYRLINSNDLFQGTPNWEVHFKLIGE